MTTLAALHNADMVAGGTDKISGFGDRLVNSSIGAQWKHSERLPALDAVADESRKAGPGSENEQQTGTMQIGKRMDEHFAAFLEEFGPAIEARLVPPSSIERYRGQLPERLLDYWAEHGWAGYGDGLFWTVNPQEYEPVLNAWLGDTQFLQQDKYHIIARNAFGELYLWGEKTGSSLTVETFDSMAYPSEGKVKHIAAGRSNDAMSAFFSGKSRENYDAEDDDERLLFARALKKLGKLKHDEMYGFVPTIALGGRCAVENLEKVKAIPYLKLLAQLAPLRVSEPPLH